MSEIEEDEIEDKSGKAALAENGSAAISPEAAMKLFNPLAGGLTEIMNPWDRQPDETVRSWQAFCIYRDMGEGRSIQKTANQLSKTMPHIKDWCARYSWVRRAAAYDSYLDARKRQSQEEHRASELEAFRLRQVRTANAQANVALRMLSKIGRSMDNMEARPAIPARDGKPAIPAREEVHIDPERIPNWARAAAFLATASASTEGQALAINELFDSLGLAATGKPALQGTHHTRDIPTPASIAAGA